MDYTNIEPNKAILLLNSDYNPINITSWQRAVVLVLKNKAQVLSSRVIRLIHYIRLPFSRIMSNKPTRNSIMKRDDYRCQYCGSLKDLTIDHVIPQSKGGDSSWTNMVTACISCNSKKGNKSLKEANMTLYTTPKPPFNKMTLTLIKSNVDDWKQFIYT